MMSSAISILLYIGIVFFLLYRIRKRKGGQTVVKTQERMQKSPAGAGAGNAQRAARAETAVLPRKQNGINDQMKREKINIVGWEDRKHDWLAKQREEERVAKNRMSDMFQMKMEHQNQCDAEMLKQFHAVNCDADGIDRGAC